MNMILYDIFNFIRYRKCKVLSSARSNNCIIYDIVPRGTGYETLQVSKAITKVLQFMLKVLRKCTIFCFTITYYG